jgi:hypothetical protein
MAYDAGMRSGWWHNADMFLQLHFGTPQQLSYRVRCLPRLARPHILQNGKHLTTEGWLCEQQHQQHQQRRLLRR